MCISLPILYVHIIVRDTEEYDSVQRARILLDTMAYSGMGQELNLYKDSRLVIDIDDGNLTTEAAAKIKEGYEIYKSSELSDEEHMPYNDFLEMTKCIVEIWNDQISDGRGFIIFWLACKMMVDHTSIMPCHPHDALFFLIENHPALNVERKDENSMGTDILDRLDPAQISFVGNNNRLFRTLFMNYKCSVAKVFESEDITNEYEDEEDDTPMQKSQLPKGDIALVTDIMKCSEQKAVRLLKESKGEVLGALYSSSKVGKEMSEKRSPFENRIYQCMIRTTFHLKLATHGMVRALVNGHAFRLPGRRHGTTDDDEPEDFIFMLVDQSTIDRFEL